jgi:hypothetical protein
MNYFSPNSNEKLCIPSLNIFLIIFSLIIFLTNSSQAQTCTLVGEDEFTLAVDENCEAVLHSIALLNGDLTTCPNASFQVYVYDNQNSLVVSGDPVIIPASYVGTTLHAVVEDQISGNQSDVVPLNVLDNQKPELKCYVSMDEIVGEISGDSPSYNRANNNANSNDCSPSVVGTDVKYEALEFFVTESGSYSLDFLYTADVICDPDICISLYQDAFDPLDPCLNLLHSWNKYHPFESDPYTVELMEGLDYFLVSGNCLNEYCPTPNNYIYQTSGPGELMVKLKDCHYTVYCHEDIEETVVLKSVDNCDEDAEIVLINYEEEVFECGSGEETDVIRRENYLYQVIDHSGNNSNLYPVVVSVKPMPVEAFQESIVFPKNKTLLEGTALSCSDDLLADILGNPHPAVSGMPEFLIGGEFLSLSELNQSCPISVSFMDSTLMDQECMKSIVRHWTVIQNLCGQDWNIFNADQEIEIVDNTAPQLACPDNYILESDNIIDEGQACGTQFVFPFPEISDDCNSLSEWNVRITNEQGEVIGFFPNDLATFFPLPEMFLPLGENKVEYSVSDACGNYSTCLFTVTVSPYSLCDLISNDKVQISVGQNCEAWITADDILELPCPCSDPEFNVKIFQGNNLIAIGNPAVVSYEYIGKTLWAYVEDINSGNTSVPTELNIYKTGAPTIECYESIQYLSGSIEATDPIYTRTLVGSVEEYCLLADNNMDSVPYHLFSFFVDRSDSYEFSLVDSNKFLKHLALYENSFDPSAPCKNLLSSNRPVLSVNLQAGKNYILVTSLRYNYDDIYEQFGAATSYELIFSSEGEGKVMIPNPDCAYELWCFEDVDEKIIMDSNYDCDGDPAVVLVDENVEINSCLGDMPGNISRIIHRKYMATDYYAQTNVIKEVTISIRQFTLEELAEDIIWPDSLTQQKGNALECITDPQLNQYGFPLPSLTGEPVVLIDEEPIPLTDGYVDCQLVASYQDLPVWDDEYRTVFIRQWQVNLMTCGGGPLNYEQRIEIIKEVPLWMEVPPDLNISCNDVYDPDDLTASFGWPEVHGCHVVVTTDSSIVLNSCNEGTITRNFTAIDGYGNMLTDQQEISITRTQYFGYENGMTNADGFGAIQWPEDYSLNECITPDEAQNDPRLQVEETGIPLFQQGPCDQIAFSYEDLIYIYNQDDPNEESFCFMILRMWTVVDWCHQMEGDLATWEWNQVITVGNDIAPVLVSNPMDTVFCTYDQECEEGYIELTAAAEDDCTPDEDLTWRVQIDLHNDNPPDTWDITLPWAQGNLLTFSGNLSIGKHLLQWEVRDACNNVTTNSQRVEVKNCKLPTFICPDNTLLELENGQNGPEVVLTAESLDKGSFHSCGYPVTISFSQDTTDKTSVYSCDDVGVQEVEMWVSALAPDGSLLQDYCITTVEIREENILPVPICISSLAVDLFLGPDGPVAQLSAVDFNAASYHACGYPLTFSFSQDPDDALKSFYCSNLGKNNIEIWVTAYTESGTMVQDFCQAVVFVYDNQNRCDEECDNDSTPPVCKINNITVILDENGTAGIVPTDIDGGSYDNCDIVDMTVVPSQFDCQDLGENEVVFTVEDSQGNSSWCMAIVTVEDNSGPLCSTQDIEVILAADGTYTLDPQEIYTGAACGGTDVMLDAAPTTFDCDDLGQNQVSLWVLDNYGNIETCNAIVTIVDTIAPECMVKNIFAFLDDDGMATIGFDDIDDGSVDPCGFIVETSLSQTIFTCEDLGDNIVTVTLADDSGNTSVCESIVTVVDTIAPICVSPAFVTVALGETGEVFIPAYTIAGASFDNCGPITMSLFPDVFDCNDIGYVDAILTVSDPSGNSSQCMVEVEIQDKLSPQIICPSDTMLSCTEWPVTDYSIFGEATGFDNCWVISIEEIIVENVNECGIGTATRQFSIEDIAGNINSCTQVITFAPFGDQFDEDNIIWGPLNIYADNCDELAPGSLGGQPVYALNNVECFNISDSYMDTDLNPTSICPDSIQRSWIVVDSCQLNVGSGTGIWTFEQLIVVIDTVPPEISAPSDTVVCGPGYIDLHGDATDCGLTDGVMVTNDSPYADDPNSADASGDYPTGNYDVTITASDACGNVSEYTYNLVVLDAFGECGSIIKNIDNNQMVTIHLDEIFLPNTNCFDNNLVKFSLDSGDINLVNLTFDCSNLGDNFVPVYRWENGVLIGEYCISMVTLIDPFEFCPVPPMPQAIVSGSLQTAEGYAIDGVEIALSGSEFPDQLSDEDGSYAFPPLAIGGSYRVKPSLDSNHGNGVSTLDLILMQKHILGIKAIDSPFKIIAADVNKDQKISAVDLLEIRKLILGLTDRFEHNSSWRFVDQNYAFENDQNPLAEPFPENRLIRYLEQDMAIDFTGVKVGDINQDASISSNPQLENRHQHTWPLLLPAIEFDKGQLLEIPVLAGSAENIHGFQFTLDYDEEMLDFEEIRAGALAISRQNYNDWRDKLTLSWNAQEARELEKEEVLFYLVFRVASPGVLEDAVAVNSMITRAEAYNAGLEALELKLDFRKEEREISSYRLYQNTPNPFSERSSIRFEIPQAAKVSIRLFDRMGQHLKTFEDYYEEGEHELLLDSHDLPNSGMIIYQMHTGDFTATRRMILVK